MHRVYLASFVTAAILSACGGGGDDVTEPGDAVPPPGSISIVADAQTKGTNAFAPNPFSVSLASGGKVRWFNTDRAEVYGSSGTAHDVTADDGSSFRSGSLAPGRAYEATLAAEGTYPYHCSIHPTMRGTITVTP